MGGQIDKKRSERYHGDIQERTDIPPEFVRNILEYHQRRGSGADVEHIDVPLRSVPENKIDAKRNCAKANERGNGVKIILFGLGKPARCDKVESDEHQGHVPQKGVDRKRPVFVNYSRRLNERHKTAQKVKRGHKSVHSALNSSLFQKGCDQTKIHGHATKLEGEDPPLIAALAYVEVVKKLLINLGYY